jgi:LEA14-like dessication related protein
MTPPAEIVQDVLQELRRRKGFDWWWQHIDSDTQSEIRTALETRVQTRLEDLIPR